MWIYLIFPVALALVLTPFWLGLFPPRNARCLIRIRNGSCFVLGESLPPHVLGSVSEVLHKAAVRKGFIAITSDSRIKFSRHIPKAIHQRLRNVLLNP